MRLSFGSGVLVLFSMGVSCAPAPRPATPAPATKPAWTRTADLTAYRRQVLARQGLAMLEALGDQARKSYKRETWDSSGSLLPRRFAHSLPGWYPARPCCSYSGRRCPAVEKVPPVLNDLGIGALKKPRRFQLRYFSSGTGERSTFVADARGDMGCDGRLTWFRIRGRVELKGAKQRVVQISPPEVVRGVDPRKAPLAGKALLEQALRGDDADLHFRAVHDLCKHGPPVTRALARRLVKSPRTRLRRAALSLFWRTWHEPGMWRVPSEDLPLMAPLLRDPDRDLRRKVIEQFAWFGKDRAELLRYLAALLEDRAAKPDLVLGVVKALCTITGQAGVPHALAALEHNDPVVRRAVATQLGTVRGHYHESEQARASVAALTRRLKQDSSAMVRNAAVRSLARYGDLGIGPLISALKDSDATVRNNAAHHLGQMGTAARRALPALRAQHKATTNKADRALVAEAIQKVQGKKPVSAGLSSSGSTGVPECDDMIAKYELCARTRMPLAVRPAVLSSLRQARKVYRDAARLPAGRKDMANACIMILMAAKKSKRHGCKW